MDTRNQENRIQIPYCLALNSEDKLCFPINRNYKQIGYITNKFVEYPITEDIDRIYLFDDMSAPWHSVSNKITYLNRLEKLLNNELKGYSFIVAQTDQVFTQNLDIPDILQKLSHHIDDYAFTRN